MFTRDPNPHPHPRPIPAPATSTRESRPASRDPRHLDLLLMNNRNLKKKCQCYYEKLLLSKTVQLVTFIVKDSVTCEFT